MSEMFFVNSGQKYAENGIELSLANVLDNFSFYFKSLATKTGGEITFFHKIHVCDHCDLQGHHRSQAMVRNERLFMSFYLSIIVTIGISGKKCFS